FILTISFSSRLSLSLSLTFSFPKPALHLYISKIPLSLVSFLNIKSSLSKGTHCGVTPRSGWCMVLRHIHLAVRNDEELNKLLRSLAIAIGRVMANIHNLLWLKNGVGSSKAANAC
ncbi:hypothetical protein GIB67_042107, partial [Kingdonia uniflora]